MLNKVRIVATLWILTLLALTNQAALAHDGPHVVEVPFGGHSLFPWVMIFLTFIAIGVAALVMFRSGR